MAALVWAERRRRRRLRRLVFVTAAGLLSTTRRSRSSSHATHSSTLYHPDSAMQHFPSTSWCAPSRSSPPHQPHPATHTLPSPDTGASPGTTSSTRTPPTRSTRAAVSDRAPTASPRACSTLSQLRGPPLSSCSCTALTPSLDLARRQPIVTGTSVLGLKFKGGVMLAADNLGPSTLPPPLLLLLELNRGRPADSCTRQQPRTARSPASRTSAASTRSPTRPSSARRATWPTSSRSSACSRAS